MTRSIAFIAGCMVVMSAANVFAAIITVPTSLNPGDSYRLAFLTSGFRNGASSNIADYNTFVTNAANAVPDLVSLGTTWKAIVSTGGLSPVSARDNTNTLPSFAGGSLGVPIFLLNDTKLVDSNDDLWDGTIDLPLERTELDTVSPLLVNVWTGTSDDGTVFPGAGLGDTVARDGASSQVSSIWISLQTQSPFSAGVKHVYAISGELTVVPEPGTFTLLITALGAVGVFYRGCRRRTAHRC